MRWMMWRALPTRPCRVELRRLVDPALENYGGVVVLRVGDQDPLGGALALGGNVDIARNVTNTF